MQAQEKLLGNFSLGSQEADHTPLKRRFVVQWKKPLSELEEKPLGHLQERSAKVLAEPSQPSQPALDNSSPVFHQMLSDGRLSVGHGKCCVLR